MSEDQKTFRILFEGVSVAEAGKEIENLQQRLQRESPDISTNIVKDDQTSQDFGATLVLVLGAPAVVVIARGIADHLRQSNKKVRLETKDGVLIAEGISGEDYARIAEALSSDG